MKLLFKQILSTFVIIFIGFIIGNIQINIPNLQDTLKNRYFQILVIFIFAYANIYAAGDFDRIDIFISAFAVILLFGILTRVKHEEVIEESYE